MVCLAFRHADAHGTHLWELSRQLSFQCDNTQSSNQMYISSSYWGCESNVRNASCLARMQDFCHFHIMSCQSCCLSPADLVITHALEWPSLTVQWLPVTLNPLLTSCWHDSPCSNCCAPLECALPASAVSVMLSWMSIHLAEEGSLAEGALHACASAHQLPASGCPLRLCLMSS